MKEFFNRKNVAVTITLVVIVIALVIGFTSAPKQAATSTTSQTAASASSDAAGWAKKNYGQYEDFLEDDADLFSDTTLETFAKYNAQLDYTYGSIMGLVTTDDLDGRTTRSTRARSWSLAIAICCCSSIRTRSSGTLPMATRWLRMSITIFPFSLKKT